MKKTGFLKCVSYLFFIAGNQLFLLHGKLAGFKINGDGVGAGSCRRFYVLTVWFEIIAGYGVSVLHDGAVFGPTSFRKRAERDKTCRRLIEP